MVGPPIKAAEPEKMEMSNLSKEAELPLTFPALQMDGRGRAPLCPSSHVPSQGRVKLRPRLTPRGHMRNCSLVIHLPFGLSVGSLINILALGHKSYGEGEALEVILKQVKFILRPTY